jgi:hypothetical protein
MLFNSLEHRPPSDLATRPNAHVHQSTTRHSRSPAVARYMSSTVKFTGTIYVYQLTRSNTFQHVPNYQAIPTLNEHISQPVRTGPLLQVRALPSNSRNRMVLLPYFSLV